MKGSPHQNRLRSPWWHRPAAVLLIPGLVGLSELFCAWFGWGNPNLQSDPFVGFSAIRPLFVRDGANPRLGTAPSRLKWFPKQTFSRTKPPDTVRIFCFGGSTVQGNPYSIETSFPTWLQLSLEAADPDRRWEIINVGGISYASYRLVPIWQECLSYEPDLFMLCSGHNEFLEDRTYTELKHSPRWLRLPLQWISQLRTFNLARNLWLRSRPTSDLAASTSSSPRETSLLKEDVDAWLDYEGGLKAYHRDESWHTGVRQHFAYNVRRMLDLAQHRDVPVILMLPPSNLRDCLPFKSEHRDDFTRQDWPTWSNLTSQAQARLPHSPTQALPFMEEAVRLDNQHALTLFRLAQVYDALQHTNNALQAYVQARDLDICPLRILSPMESDLRRLAHETDTPLVDVQALLTQVSPDGITSDLWLADHVHPTIEGHKLIAHALMETLTNLNWIRPAPGWNVRRDLAWTNQLASLPPDYFEEGKRALEGLRAWTEGRASGPPIDYRLFGEKATQR